MSLASLLGLPEPVPLGVWLGGALVVAICVVWAVVAWRHELSFFLFVKAVVTDLRRPGRAKPAQDAPPPPEDGTLAEALAAPGARADPYVRRVVVDEAGIRRGRLVGVEGELALLVDKALYAVPCAQLRIEPRRLVAVAVDWERARAVGLDVVKARAGRR